jgi:hypothetical protein
MRGELLKTPLLKEKPNDPTPDSFRLPSWWPGSRDGSVRSLLIMFIATFLICAVIFLASGQWLWGGFLVAAAVLMAMPYRQIAAAERLLDETERKLALEEPAADDSEEREQFLASLPMLDADEDQRR